jgi:hypothetical protein
MVSSKKVTTLELFQHHFSQTGHRGYLLVTRIYLTRQPPTDALASREASAALAASFWRVKGKLPSSKEISGHKASEAKAPSGDIASAAWILIVVFSSHVPCILAVRHSQN